MTIGRDHAVVLGGSIAGMLAARVLAEEFSHVSVVERDPLPGGRTGHRRGVPHGHHVHGLLTRGQMVMEDLLPGLTSQLLAQRALTGDLQGNVRWYVAGRQLPQAIAGLPLVSASRPLIEGSIRARVRALPNVTIWDGYDVVGLTASANRQRITGARVSRSGDGAAMTMLADLVIDATGRGSRTPLWLGELGHQPPAEERVRIDLGYASALFEAPPRELIRDDIVISTARFPGQNRGGVLQMLEGGRCLVTLAGILGEHPPVERSDSSRTPRRWPHPPRTRSFGPHCRSPSRRGSGCQPTCGAATNGCGASPPVCSSPATPCATSTRCTGRA
jgi:hypothetical protein